MHSPAESPWSIDTSILINATAVDLPETRRSIALGLMERLFRSESGRFAGPTLGEYLHTVLHQGAMAPAIALEAVKTWSLAAREDFDAALLAPAHEHAWELAATCQYPVWRALTIATCAEHGVKTLFCDNTGVLKRPLGVQLINPFAEPELP
jgi:predicted nucleic acid-binding protein